MENKNVTWKEDDFSVVLYTDALPDLFALAKKLAPVLKHPILANNFELLVELLQKTNTKNVIIKCAEGISSAQLLSWFRKLRQRSPKVRVFAEVQQDSPEIFESLIMAEKGLEIFSPSTSPDRIATMIDLAAFNSQGVVASAVSIELIDYLQLLIMNRRSCRIKVEWDNQHSGCIIVENGEFVDAHCNGCATKGNQALLIMLALKQGSFTEHPLPETFDRSITGRSDMLILEAMRLRDEQERPPPNDDTAEPATHEEHNDSF